MIVGFVGPEGGGKTASMTWAALQAWSSGRNCYAFSGYEAYFHDKGDNGDIKESYTITQEVGPAEWAKVDEDLLNNCFLAVDEIQQFFGAEKWMGLLDRIFSWICQQRRKLNMTIAYTTHNLMWINNRIRNETHMVIYCKDLYWDPYWQDKQPEKGTLVQWDCYDHLGLFGHPREQIASIRVPIKQLWDCFESYRKVNVWDGLTQAYLKNRPRVEIDLGAPAYDSPYAGLPDDTQDIVEFMRGAA